MLRRLLTTWRARMETRRRRCASCGKQTDDTAVRDGEYRFCDETCALELEWRQAIR